MSQRFIHIRIPNHCSSVNNLEKYIELDVYVNSAMTFRDLIMDLIMGKYIDIPTLAHDLSYINVPYAQYAIVIEGKDIIEGSNLEEEISQSKYFDDLVKFGGLILQSGVIGPAFANYEISRYVTYSNFILKHPVNGVELKLPKIAPRVMTINLMINQLINNCTIPILANRTYYTVEKDNKEVPLWYTLSQLDYKDGDVITLVVKEYLNQ